MSKGLSVNRLAWNLLERVFEEQDLFGVNVEKTKSGVMIVDAGIQAQGGFEAGKLVTEICMGGCAQVEIVSRNYDGIELPSVFVRTDHPLVATLGSQYAGWQIKEDDYFAIGSGPGRALALKPKSIYDEIDYRDSYQRAIVVLETDKMPPASLLERLVKDCGVSHEALAVIITPTASLAGSVQVSGRIVETGIHKLRRLGFDVSLISYAWGAAPIAPLHPKFTHAMARTNDAILYGGTAYYVVNCDDDDELEETLRKSPSNTSTAYGKPFFEIFKEANYDFYKIDPNLFAPAVVIANNVRTGTTFKFGGLNPEALKQSFGIRI